MNHLFIFLIIFISSISCSYQNDYSGVWESNGKTFENSLILEKIKGKGNNDPLKVFFPTTLLNILFHTMITTLQKHTCQDQTLI